MAPEQPQPAVAESPEQPGFTPDEGDNARWAGFLKDIPTAFHSQFKNQLKEWDRQVNGRFQDIHKEWEPYKPFREAKVDPEQINYGLQLMQLLETQPYELYQALAQLPDVQQMIQPEEPEPDSEEQYVDPKFQQLEQLVQIMAQQMLNQGEQQTAAQADSMLEEEIEAARQQFGDFDMNYVLQYAYAKESSIEEAVQAYRQMEQSILTNQNRPSSVAPQVMGGGGVPSNHIDSSKLSEKDRKSLAVQMLEAARQQRG